MFCHKCGFHAASEDAEVCVNCGVRLAKGNANKVKSEGSIMHWLSLILFFVGFITFGILGGDYYLQEVNIWDYLTIPISLGGVIAGIVLTPHDSTGRIVLKVICIILNALLLLGSIGWSFM